MEELQLPMPVKPYKKEARLYPIGEMWRNTVRRQLRLQESKLAIVSMSPSLPDQTGASQTSLVHGHGEPVTWRVFHHGKN